MQLISQLIEVKLSVQGQSFLTDILHSISQSLQAHDMIVPQTLLKLQVFQILYSLIKLNIQHYIYSMCHQHIKNTKIKILIFDYSF